MNDNYITTLSAEGELKEPVTTEETVANSSFENFLKTLPVMGKGMLGIFIVTAVIILTIIALNKFTSRPPKKENDEQ